MRLPARYYLTPAILPGLAGLLGLTGLAGGLNSLSSPTTVVKAFGFTSPASFRISASQTDLMRAYGVRNIRSGLSIVSLTLAWSLEKSAMDREVINGCLSVVL
jgi:hypothetical protein